MKIMCLHTVVIAREEGRKHSVPVLETSKYALESNNKLCEALENRGKSFLIREHEEKKEAALGRENPG